MIEQEIEQERQLDKMYDTSRETNPYKELIVNNAEKIEPLMTQMEQWSILSNVLNYVQHSRLLWKVLSETELRFSSKLTSFCSQTWLLLLVCLGKCFPLEYPKECCSI